MVLLTSNYGMMRTSHLDIAQQRAAEIADPQLVPYTRRGEYKLQLPPVERMPWFFVAHWIQPSLSSSIFIEFFFLLTQSSAFRWRLERKFIYLCGVYFDVLFSFVF